MKPDLKADRRPTTWRECNRKSVNYVCVQQKERIIKSHTASLLQLPVSEFQLINIHEMTKPTLRFSSCHCRTLSLDV